jgi:hypothetical protein
MKKILIMIVAVCFSFAGCLKDTPNNDFSKIFPIVELFYYDASGTAHGGLENFAKDAVIAAGTTPVSIDFSVNLASVNPFDKDLTVTIGVDDAARTIYNASNTAQYEAMPAGAYTLTGTTGVIKAGQRRANFNIKFDPSKIDPSKNLMLPISIKDAQGQTISGNFGTIYFHTIGNSLAGNYKVSGTRYNYTGTASWNGVFPVPAGYTATTDLANTKLGSPVDSKTLQFDMANLGSLGYQYLLTYDPSTPNNITVNFNQAFLDADSKINVAVHTYDPATKTIHIVVHYNNNSTGTGNDRIIDETFVKL